MTFKKLSLPTMTLPYALGVNDSTLPLGYADSDTLAAQLAIGEDTWVTITNGVSSEAIKVGTRDYMRNTPILQRGAMPLAFSEGSCVSFGWTDESIAEVYPESGLEFIDGCGKKTDCACKSLPSELTMGQPVSLVVPYVGAPPSRIVSLDIPGLTYSTNDAAVSITGTPTTPGVYTISVKITKGGLSRAATCRVSVVDPAVSSNGSGC